MSCFFTSPDTFWNEFIQYFIVLSGALAIIQYNFINKFIGNTNTKKRYCLVFLLIYYLISAVCIEYKIVGLSLRLTYFLFLFCFTCFLGKIKNRHNISIPFATSLLIVTVLTLCDGVLAPIVHLLPILNKFENVTGFIILNILLTLFTILLLYFPLKAINHYLVINLVDKLPFLFVLYIPLTLLILLSQSIFNVGYTNKIEIIDNKIVSVFNNYQILIIFCFAFLCLFVILFSYKKVLQQIAQENHKVLLENQLIAQQIYTKEASIRYKMTSSFRHDLNNHLTILKQLISNNQIENATEYLQHFNNVANNISYPSQTGNITLDALFADKLTIAQESDIYINLNIDIPKDIKINDFDLCVIFFNALDNATSACNCIKDSKKWIDINAKRNQDFFIIDMINSYDKTATSKKGSGIGLQTIKMMCDKYNGTINIEKGNDTFTLTILLPL